MNRFWIPSLATLLLLPPVALARPYVTLQDDGTLFSLDTSTATVAGISSAVMKLYDASGAPRPDVVSVWTTFDMGGESDGTFFLPQANGIKGIGFDGILSTSGLLTGSFGPVNAILLHNNVLVLGKRATDTRADTDKTGFAQYLFLLEFSHQWLAAARVPGTNPHVLGTWPHWSFWLNSGGSPPGGNTWQDNGDGTFSTVPLKPADVKYSNLDLYLMGLVDAGAVSSFDVLTGAVSPATPTDPYTGTRYSAGSLTDFDATPLKVTATATTYTIDDIISANGARVPATSPNNIKVGFVLMVSQDAGAVEIAADQAFFDPIAETLAPAFARATGGIATITVVTDGGVEMDAGDSDGGVPDAGATDAGDTDAGVVPTDAGIPDAGGSPDAGTSPDSGSTTDAGETPVAKSGCATGTGADGTFLTFGLVIAGVLLARRRSRP
jgi:MYXO-CTERM domain-containing protein